MKRLTLIAAAALAAMTLSAPASATDKVTICHATGNGGYVEVTAAYSAIYGQAGHFNEPGSPNKGHEDDYEGPCDHGTTTSTSSSTSLPSTTTSSSTTSTVDTTSTSTTEPSTTSSIASTTTVAPSSTTDSSVSTTNPTTSTSSTGPTTSAGVSVNTLAETGTDLTDRMVVLALLFLVLGGTAIVATRRGWSD